MEYVSDGGRQQPDRRSPMTAFVSSMKLCWFADSDVRDEGGLGSRNSVRPSVALLRLSTVFN